MITVNEMSQRTGIPAATINKACQDGRLPAHKISRDWFINENDRLYTYYIENYQPRQKKSDKQANEQPP